MEKQDNEIEGIAGRWNGWIKRLDKTRKPYRKISKESLLLSIEMQAGLRLSSGYTVQRVDPYVARRFGRE